MDCSFCYFVVFKQGVLYKILEAIRKSRPQSGWVVQCGQEGSEWELLKCGHTRFLVQKLQIF